MAEDKEAIQFSRMLTIGTRDGDRVPIFKNNTAVFDKNDKISKIDKGWIKSVFMVSGADLEPENAKNRYFSTAELKFTDTTIGGNIGINSRPQFTRYCDIRSQGRRMDRFDTTVKQEGHNGMGTYYSEAIDDNSLNLYLEFGVPKFNSLFTFFSRSIDPQAVNIARTGKSSIFYSAGKILGGAAVFLMLPVISVSIWAIKAVSNIILGDKPFNYYYLNPTMHTYWSTVNTIVIQMSTELGVLIPTFMKESNNKGIGLPVKIDQEDLSKMSELMPDIIGEDNYIDVFAIATRAQAMANKQLELERKMYESFQDDEDGGKKFIKNTAGSPVRNELGRSFKTWINDVLKETGDLFQPPKKKEPQDTPSEPNEWLGNASDSEETYKTTNEEDKEGYFDNATKYFKSAMISGGGHAIFKVDYVGSINESFTNSVTDVPAATMLKNISRSAKEVKFNFAGGNLVGGSDGIVDAAKQFLTGGLDGLTFGLSNSLATLFGDAYVDIPKMWDDSSASLPKLNYTMQLIAPYGNIISQLQNIYIPLAMLLAGALPLATGKNSYTSPFICKAFLKGMHNVQLGMITDLSITRGTSNLAFNKQKRVLAVDVSFSITDFSQLMSAPVDTSIFNGSFNAGMDENNVFGRYISTLASRDLLTDMYAMPKAKIRLSRLKYEVDKTLSSSYWMYRTGSFANDVFGFALTDRALNLSERN